MSMLPTGLGEWRSAVQDAPNGPAPCCDPSDGQGEHRDASAMPVDLGASLPSRPARAAANDARAQHGCGHSPEDDAADGNIHMQRSA